jgi:hypothetical protein
MCDTVNREQRHDAHHTTRVCAEADLAEAPETVQTVEDGVAHEADLAVCITAGLHEVLECRNALHTSTHAHSGDGVLTTSTQPHTHERGAGEHTNTAPNMYGAHNTHADSTTSQVPHANHTHK